MFGLLRLPNFAEPFVAGFALTNLAYLGVQIFKALPFCVRWDFDCALLRRERHLIVGILVCRAVKYRTDPFADYHVIHAPTGIEQNAVAVFCSAIRERDQ